MKIDVLDLALFVVITSYVVFLTWPHLIERISQLQKSRFFRRKRKATQAVKIPAIEEQIRRLSVSCEISKSHMVLAIYDNQKIEVQTHLVGNEFDLIQLLVKASDKNPEADEFLQIISKHYNSKFLSK